MVSLFSRLRNDGKAAVAVPVPRTVKLELSGPALNVALGALLGSCEEDGGVERYVQALKFKTELFQDAFAADRGDSLSVENFVKLCMFMPTVRRRISDYLEPDKFPELKTAMKALLGEGDTNTRIAAFEAKFPAGKKFRWVRDLAAEILHNTKPQAYPLMTRWVWDIKSNSGVLREIWHGENVDSQRLDIADDFETYQKLREELCGYLTSNGVYSDVLHYADLLSAQIYAGYIAAQGGTFLKADFAAKQDPIIFTRRLLGLDGVKAKSSLSLSPDVIEGDAVTVHDILRLNGNS